ncbi:mRNA 3' end processing factor [Neurospora sp. IMI 360204]|nr:mRNA 3' end processing factor [Neurospora sp. IMI 360204]
MSDEAADVAEDYRQALEDLTVNSRIEIATLTNIARENAHHGLAIADVLTNHIKKVPPPRTLPALYVLDSVVKNVPTPYALYFGPKLYSIFMGAYTKVDNPTRRKMDEMLKTWKEPVPGSISTKPVFPPDVVKPIENALIAAKNVALQVNQSSYQGQQYMLRGARPPAPPHRDTPTPPNVRPATQQPGQQYQPPNGHMPPQGGNPAFPMRPHTGPDVLPPRATTQPPYGAPYHQPQAPHQGISIERLRDDIQQLIVAERAEFARDPLDVGKQTRLKALLDLQTLIQRPDVPQEQLMLVKEKITELSVNMRSASAASAAAGVAPVAAPHHYPVPYTATPTPPVIAGPVPPQVPGARPPSAPAVAGLGAGAGGALSIDSLFGQGALAALLAGATRKSATPTPSQTGTPQPPIATPIPPPAVPPVAGAPVPVPAAAAGSLAALSPALAAVLRSQTPTMATAAAPPPLEAPKPAASAPPTVPAAALPAPVSNPSALLAMLRQSGLLAGTTPAPAPAPVAVAPAAAAWTYTLKQYRGPHLINRLHEDLGPPCTQCGRRFGTDEEGRRKKTAHMDWHFRVHQRVTDAERRGQHRSWWVEQSDWVNSLEAIDIDHGHRSDITSGGGHGGHGGGVPGQDTLNYDDDDADDDDYDPEANFNNSYNPNSVYPGAGADMGGHSGGGKAMTHGGHGGGRKGGKKNGLNWLPVPEDSAKVNNMCPICQERFEMKWLDEAQEWVWMDATKVGERVYHYSCHKEVNGTSVGGADGGSSGMMSMGMSGENGLGGRKRKAEVSI